MKTERIKQLCTLFYASHYIPLFIFSTENGDVLSYSPISDLLPSHFVKKNLADKTSPGVFFSSETGYWGRIDIAETPLTLFIGPVFSSEITSDMLHGFMHWHAFSAERKSEIFSFLNGIPKYTYYRFINLLTYLNYELNGVSVDILEVFDEKSKPYESIIGTIQAERYFDSAENNNTHGTYQLEQAIIDLIRGGEVEKLKGFLGNAIKTEAIKEGKLAENPIRQAKNIFIGATTMFGKSGAIKGGLDVEQTYQLIDSYIQECELLTSIEDITALQYNMVIDFASRVAENKMPEGISEDIFTCTQYISNRINEPIGINDLADHIGKSRAYLTVKFKKETGKTVNEYILDKRLSESKSLLKHTNKSISEIAYFLCFSSQSYYQTLFKKKYGETPHSYRKRYIK